MGWSRVPGNPFRFDLHDRKPFIRCSTQFELPCPGVPRLLIEKFSDSDATVTDSSAPGLPSDGPTVTAHPDVVAVEADGQVVTLSRSQADELRESLEAALSASYEFVRTTGEHRTDGSYVVSRRAADSAGHRKVFDSWSNLRRLYDRLPVEFTAETVGRSGLTGGRRHMLLWHFVEHPAFECTLASRQPLTVRKRAPEGDSMTGESATDGPDARSEEVSGES